MKTTFPKLAKRTGLSATYRSIASALARGRTVAVISLHQDVSIESLRAAGANPARVLISEPDTETQVRDIHDALRRSRCVDRCYVIGARL
jgi:hypothetical protein